MGGSQAAYAAGVIWSILGMGALLVGLSLARSAGYIVPWQRSRAEDEGETVLLEHQIQPGQSVALRAGEKTDALPVQGTIVSVNKRTILLTLENEAAGSARASAWTGRVGETVTLTVTGSRALFQFRTTMRDVRPAPARPETWCVEVARPLWMARMQRRRHARIPLQATAEFEHAEPSSGLSSSASRRPFDRLPFLGRVSSLSGCGLSAEVCGVFGANEAAQMLAGLPPDTILRVRLPMPALSPLLARVCRSERMVVRGGLGIRLACEFLPMPDWEQELLISQLFRIQREHLHSRTQNG